MELTFQKRGSEPQKAAQQGCLSQEVSPPLKQQRLVPTPASPTAFCSFSFLSCVRPPPTLSPPPAHSPPTSPTPACGICLLTHWTRFWLVSEVGPSLWCPGMPCLPSYAPAGSAHSATPTRSHTLALSSRSCSSQTPRAPASHSLATNPVFQFSPSLPPLSLFSRRGLLPWVSP